VALLAGVAAAVGTVLRGLPGLAGAALVSYAAHVAFGLAAGLAAAGGFLLLVDWRRR